MSLRTPTYCRQADANGPAMVFVPKSKPASSRAWLLQLKSNLCKAQTCVGVISDNKGDH